MGQSHRKPHLRTMVDLGECNINMCHSLGPPIEDLPNWRRVPGFPVFVVGQPTEKGFEKIPDKIGKEKTIWFNCRQEPVAYVNGVSVTPRSKKNPHANIEGSDCLEDKLVSAIEGKKAEGKVKLTKDKAEADNPMDREEEDEDHAADDLKGFTKVLSVIAEGPIPGMQVLRVPVIEEKALPEAALDVIVNALKGENPATTQCIFSSQLGQGRTTLGMTVACIVKAVLMSTKLNKMVETGIGSPEWAENIIQNLRKCIIRTKYKYDAATEDRQIVWKKMIINFIERYFYLICFATYAKEHGPT